jgi:hypothetical protein
MAADAPIFDSLASPGEIRARERKGWGQAMADSFAIKNPAERTGRQLGIGLGTLIKGFTGFKSQEEVHAQALQDAFDNVDKTWKDDPKALPAENAAGRIAALRQATGSLLNPAQRLELIGKETALRSDAFNQSRLRAGDERDAGRYEDERDRAALDLKNAQVDYTKLKVAHEGLGANQWVFEMPDGSKQMAGQGGDDFSMFMQLAQDPANGIKVLGTFQDLQKHANAMELAGLRDKAAIAAAAAKNKGVKFTDKRLGEYTDLDSVGNILGYLNSPAAQEGLSRFGGAAGLLDRAEEKVAAIPILSDAAALFGINGDTKSTKVKVYVDRLRGVQQSLIKGVPSNNDQYIYDLSNPQSYVSPKVNAIRMQLITDDATARMRTAYAKAKEEIDAAGATGKQAVPLSLVHALTQMGIDPSDIGTSAEEQAKLERATQHGTDIWDAVRASGGARGQDEPAPTQPKNAPAFKTKTGASITY